MAEPEFQLAWKEHTRLMSEFWKPSPRHFVICDSRGKFLKQHIMKANTDSISFDMSHWDGESLKQLMVRAERHLSKFPRDYVYIFGGQCDVTSMNKMTRKIFCEWSCEEQLTTHLVAYSEVGLDWIHHFHPEANVVLCPLTGCELAKKVMNVYPGQQAMINNAIQGFNRLIMEINEQSGVATPWTANHFFKERKGVVEVKYGMLGPDGIHPTGSLLEKWGQDFVNCFRKNPLMLTHNFQC